MRIEFVLLVLAASAVKLVDGKPGHSIPLLTATQVSPTVPPAPAAAPANASSRSQSPRSRRQVAQCSIRSGFNYCDDWCNNAAIWSHCDTHSAGSYTCNCAGCNGCAAAGDRRLLPWNLPVSPDITALPSKNNHFGREFRRPTFWAPMMSDSLRAIA